MKLQITASPSPITTETVALAGITFSDLQSDGKRLYFAVQDPANQGKSTVQSIDSSSSKKAQTHTDLGHNVRSAVHEYGGGAFCIDRAGGIIYTEFPSHTVYWQKARDKDPRQIFPQEGATSPCRIAEMLCVYASDDDATDPICLLAVMEDHTHPEPAKVVNSIVTISMDGAGMVSTVASGHDFYSSPTLQGEHLAFVAWNHPNMPWDSTTLFTLRVEKMEKGLKPQGTPKAVHGYEASKEEISVYSPQWYKDRLLFLSDLSGWYNLYEWSHGIVKALYPKDAEFTDAWTGWILGVRNFTILDDGTLAAVYTNTNTEAGPSGSRIVLIRTDGKGDAIDVGDRTCLPAAIGSLVACGSKLYFKGGSSKVPQGIWCWEHPGDSSKPAVELLASMEPLAPEITAVLSEPRPIQFPSSSAGVGHAYGYYYAPTNLNQELPANFRTPLLVKVHGGPTARTSTTMHMEIQFWASRGFGVLDVNYGGSTGYGTAFRRSLNGLWGVIDLDDVSNGAQYCVDQGWANPDWLSIDGGSAGGYTTLAVLAFRSVFKAGASLYGIADLSALAEETHKFESRYLDNLVAPYPEGKQVYMDRCPVNFIDKYDCPVILLQGDEDKVVPPQQAEMMFKALNDKGISTALVMYKGEQHGFRKAANIRHCLLSEYFFFCEVFNIEPQGEGDFAGVKIGERIEV